MSDVLKLASIASLIGDPARANMLFALMDGRAHTAKELAYYGRVTAQTASGHLAKLTEGGLLSVVKQGRHRYFRIADPKIAEMLETMMVLASEPRKPKRTWRHGAQMRQARLCYDHFAGRLGVAIADSFHARGFVELHEEGGLITPDGEDFFRKSGLDVQSFKGSKRVPCRSCLDWSERRFHIAGTIGAIVANHCMEKGWVERGRDSRVLTVNQGSLTAFSDWIGCDLMVLLAAEDCATMATTIKAGARAVEPEHTT